MHTILETTIPGQYTVRVEQRANGTFRVTYGADVTDHLDRIAAAEQYGHCVFHALECTGILNEEG